MSVFSTFNPAYGSGQTVAPGVVSTSITLGRYSKSLCITSLNSVQCYVRVGNSNAVATIADYPIPVNGQATISKFQDFDTVAFIAPGGSGSLHIMAGEGF